MKFDPEAPMFIRFPSVTRLQYLGGVSSATERPEHTFRRTFFKSNNREMGRVSSSKMESFKIVEIPKKEQIMGICTMRMSAKNEQRGHSKQEQKQKKLTFNPEKLRSVKVESQHAARKPSTQSKFRNSFSFKILRKANKNPVKQASTQLYPQFLKLFALSFGVLVNPQNGGSRLKRAKIEKGNNGMLIKQTLKNRGWWKVIEQSENKQFSSIIPITLTWTQFLNKKLLKNRDSEESEENPISVDSQGENRVLFQRNFGKLLQQCPKMMQLHFWEGCSDSKKLQEWITESQKQKVKLLNFDKVKIYNHLQKNYQLTHKKNLYMNLVKHYQQQKESHDILTVIPKTFHIGAMNWQDQLHNIRQEDKGKVWILKPGESTNQGKGIIVFKSTKDAIDHILLHPPKVPQKSLLLQEYITPMLYEGRKFDIRCFMLGLQVEGKLKFYWYEEGYIRTSSEKFSFKSASRNIHLTNDAVQKNVDNYEKYEAGNKLSYQQLAKYCLNNTNIQFFEEVLPKMRRIGATICEAAYSKLQCREKDIYFQIFGLDFLIDKGGNPYLLQVNTNPSFDVCCNHLSRLIPEVLENTFRLAIDPFVPGNKSTPDWAQNFINCNKYSLLYSQEEGVIDI